mmetsp:Transcript_123169/g.359632  ORF Transcript_123169/g.359632 Transcript_123169/m.359632 type:complete len:211 (-) Transcript_123169:1928-2560(-)
MAPRLSSPLSIKAMSMSMSSASPTASRATLLTNSATTSRSRPLGFSATAPEPMASSGETSTGRASGIVCCGICGITICCCAGIPRIKSSWERVRSSWSPHDSAKLLALSTMSCASFARPQTRCTSAMTILALPWPDSSPSSLKSASASLLVCMTPSNFSSLPRLMYKYLVTEAKVYNAKAINALSPSCFASFAASSAGRRIRVSLLETIW